MSSKPFSPEAINHIANISKMTAARESIKEELRPILQKHGDKYNSPQRDLIVRQQQLFLGSIASEITTKCGYDAMVTEARWIPQMISSRAKATSSVSHRGHYYVILLMKGRYIIQVLDMLCCMFLDCDWNLDLCFIDVFQVRTVLYPESLVFPHSKLSETKRRMLDDLKDRQDLRAVTQAAFDSAQVVHRLTGNQSAGLPLLKGSCTYLADEIVNRWQDFPSLDLAYMATAVHGFWNPCALSNPYRIIEDGTDHNWVRIRDKNTYETIEYDPTFGQFIDTPADQTYLSYFADVGQMRSIGVTSDEEMAVVSSRGGM